MPRGNIKQIKTKEGDLLALCVKLKETCEKDVPAKVRIILKLASYKIGAPPCVIWIATSKVLEGRGKEYHNALYSTQCSKPSSYLYVVNILVRIYIYSIIHTIYFSSLSLFFFFIIYSIPVFFILLYMIGDRGRLELALFISSQWAPLITWFLCKNAWFFF